MDQTDIIQLDVPLFIRLLEYAREDAKTDMDLHILAEKAIELSKEHVLTMDDYNKLLPEVKSDMFESIIRLALE